MHTENHAKKPKMACFRRFCVKEPRHSASISDENCYFYRSTSYHYTTLPYTHYTTLHYTTLHYTTLHYTTLHCTTLHYTTLHYTTLHYPTLPYTTLQYTTLHYFLTPNRRNNVIMSLFCNSCYSFSHLLGQGFVHHKAKALCKGNLPYAKKKVVFG